MDAMAIEHYDQQLFSKVLSQNGNITYNAGASMHAVRELILWPPQSSDLSLYNLYGATLQFYIQIKLPPLVDNKVLSRISRNVLVVAENILC